MSKTYKRRQNTNRLTNYDYSTPGYYYVTVCTQNREMIFGKVLDGQVQLNEYGRKVRQGWLDLPEHYSYVELDEYVVMPDHFHGIVRICAVGAGFPRPESDVENEMGDQSGAVTAPLQRRPLGRIIARFKYQSTKRINQLRHTPGQRVWQRDYHDRVIRNEKENRRVTAFSGQMTGKKHKYDQNIN